MLFKISRLELFDGFDFFGDAMNLLPQTQFGIYRFRLLLTIVGCLLFYLVILPVFSYVEYNPQEGDIIFQSLPDSELTRVIEGATGSPYSHTGIVIQKNDSWYVREAIGPVKDTMLYLWIMRGRKARFAVYRLKDQYKNFIPAFVNESEKYIGAPYDIYFQFDDEKIYCSELVFKSFKNIAHEKLGTIQKLKDLNWQPYRKFIETIEPNRIPFEREMITPQALSEAKQIKKVYSNGI